MVENNCFDCLLSSWCIYEPLLPSVHSRDEWDQAFSFFAAVSLLCSIVNANRTVKAGRPGNKANLHMRGFSLNRISPIAEMAFVTDFIWSVLCMEYTLYRLYSRCTEQNVIHSTVFFPPRVGYSVKKKLQGLDIYKVYSMANQSCLHVAVLSNSHDMVWHCSFVADRTERCCLWDW